MRKEDDFGLLDIDGMHARDLAWKVFSETGEIGYYMLYSDLGHEEKRVKDERTKDNRDCTKGDKPQREG